MKLIHFVFHHDTQYIALLTWFCFVSADANVYQRTNDIFLQNTFLTLRNATRVKCCAYCNQTDDCMSVSYQESTKTCKLSRDPLVSVFVNGQTDTSWKSYSKNEWLLVFRGTPGIGGDIYTAWVDGDDVTVDNATCMTTDSTTCDKNYRNPIVDSWTSIGMQQVKFAFYKDNEEAAFVVFNATGSNITSWFSSSNIIQSSWTSLATDSFNYFSILGHDPGRRFMINRNYGGCPVDTGYSIIVINNAFQCTYDIQTSYPQFLFSTSTTYGTAETMSGMDKADVMAIFIK
ncbi:uncharacterized protein LOC132720643 [Ruditapes philippinarum]|uniref:uncharacterized protein LOC132720643 n=1 Tax=Ruditapes philippinarum TaxID=129788 RepID=UPI00295AA2E7|nr:uncharacterized protein LOC132720643 [Ruditapes philippinarum]